MSQVLEQQKALLAAILDDEDFRAPASEVVMGSIYDESLEGSQPGT